MEFKFDLVSPYQQKAIASVVDLFRGPASNADALETKLQGAYRRPATNRRLTSLPRLVQSGTTSCWMMWRCCRTSRLYRIRNGLEVASAFAGSEVDFDIEMETGTATYVYLRTIFPLAQKYNFRKFVILVPSTPIKEGVTTSIEPMAKTSRTSTPSRSTPLSTAAPRLSKCSLSPPARVCRSWLMSIHALRGDKNSASFTRSATSSTACDRSTT